MLEQSHKPSLWRRLLKRSVTLLGTGIVFVIAGGLVLGGAGVLSERADAVVGPEPAPILTVSAISITPQLSHQVIRRFQGQVEPAQSVNLSFQQPGQIEVLLFDEGERVREGDLIASLDTRILDAERVRLEASRRSAEAQVELAELTTGRQAELRERGFASQQQLDTARLTLADLEARIAEIDAALTRIDVELSQTQILAPFDGVIATRLADEGTVASIGQPIVELLQDSRPIFRVGIDPRLADTPESFDSAIITLGGQDYAASFDSFRPDLDRQTRTRTALFRLETDDPVYLEAGTLTLMPALEQSGYLVPMSALQDGVRGLWTVLTLSPDETGGIYQVVSEAVEVLHLEGDMAYVDGTLSGETLIMPSGAHRVVPGQHVRLSEELN